MRIAKVVNCPNHNALKETRKGILLHFDDSKSDEGAWSWFLSKKCKVSYNYLVLDNGDVYEIVPENRRAWHAGKCKPSGKSIHYKDANSAFYGIAAATNNETPVTEKQKAAIIELCRFLYRKHGWSLSDTKRISGHDWEAWGRGRKVDPTGSHKDKPILLVMDIREGLKDGV